MDLRKIKKLIDILEESNLTELEIKEGEESVRLSRMPQGWTGAQRRCSRHACNTCTRNRRARRRAPPPVDEQHAASRQQAARICRPATCCARRWSARSTRRRIPTRRRSSRSGRAVKAGDTLGIIEAMKMFNQIEADICRHDRRRPRQ